MLVKSNLSTFLIDIGMLNTAKLILALSLCSLPVFAADAPRCTEADKKDHIYSANHKFAADWERCGIHHLGSNDGTTQCLRKAYGTLSAGCASCFGENASCVRDNCWWSCITGRNEACEKCAIDSCRAPMEQCTGISHYDMPSN
ncbi:MAG: hypothetical protein V4534_06745 [Myxococcota bacterium]